MKTRRSILEVSLIAITVMFILSFKKDNNKFHFSEYWEHRNNYYYELNGNRDYKAAIAQFSWMKEHGTEKYPESFDYLNLAICYAKLGDTTAATKSLRCAVIKGYLKIDEDYGWAKTAIGEKSYAVIRKELPTLKTQYYASKANQIPFMLEEKKHSSIDQFVRSPAVANILTKEAMDRLVHVADSININEFVVAVREKASPPTSSLIFHLYDDNAKFFPFIDSCMRVELFEGRLSPESYGFWYDRQLVYVEHKKQKYGNFIEYGFESTLAPVENIDSVDYYRRSIGLAPLWQSSKLKNFVLPSDYKH